MDQTPGTQQAPRQMPLLIQLMPVTDFCEKGVLLIKGGRNHLLINVTHFKLSYLLQRGTGVGCISSAYVSPGRDEALLLKAQRNNF